MASIMSRALPHLLWGWLLPVLKGRCGLCIGFASSGGTGRPELLLGQAEDEVGQALRSCNISAESEVLRGFLLVRNGLWQLLLMAGNTGTAPLARFDCCISSLVSRKEYLPPFYGPAQASTSRTVYPLKQGSSTRQPHPHPGHHGPVPVYSLLGTWEAGSAAGNER